MHFLTCCMCVETTHRVKKQFIHLLYDMYINYVRKKSMSMFEKHGQQFKNSVHKLYTSNYTHDTRLQKT